MRLIGWMFCIDGVETEISETRQTAKTSIPIFITKFETWKIRQIRRIFQKIFIINSELFKFPAYS